MGRAIILGSRSPGRPQAVSLCTPPAPATGNANRVLVQKQVTPGVAACPGDREPSPQLLLHMCTGARSWGSDPLNQEPLTSPPATALGDPASCLPFSQCQVNMTWREGWSLGRQEPHRPPLAPQAHPGSDQPQQPPSHAVMTMGSQQVAAKRHVHPAKPEEAAGPSPQAQRGSGPWAG